ncbi:GUN4 protein [Synechococcus sp. PCC 7502]|uniref:GUN4 domain-containing protein n=1 Tax=Synechococcus sp. PCC 7502 TaxID=1173263 RepID=UPI00029FF25B|nr:GUN4 domain-containing protein [Synechococcus sp. PCC 7502]AFY73932.1 GUN4 protein [Synechococcus sp. PCC 7502]
MFQILIETSSERIQAIDSLVLQFNLEQLINLISQIPTTTGGLELEELSVSIKISEHGQVILLNGSQGTGAMTLKFKRSTTSPNTYEKLENLLANKLWQEANQETWNLLCVAIHKKLGTSLTTQDIDQIPNATLNAIDKLWHKYSDGKFGFTVQSRIYKESR